MKFSRGSAGFKPILFLVLCSLPSLAHASARSLTAGGWVPEKKNLIVMPGSGEALPGADGTSEVAVLEIDNNLPSYEVVLDFTDRLGDADIISEVRLEAVGGVLGKGLADPSGSALLPGPTPGRFVWSPGPQESATLGYRVRVLVTWKRSPADQPLMAVSMPESY